MIKKVKNNTGGPITRKGKVFADQEYYELQVHEHEDWVNDTSIQAEITAGDLVINNGASDLNATDGLDHFIANDATCIRGVVVDDSAKADGYSLSYDNASGKIKYIPPALAYSYEVDSDVQVSTGSSSFVDVSLMTITPSAGTYIAMFNCKPWGLGNNALNTFKLNVGGVEIDESERITSGNNKSNLTILCKVIVNGSQAIKVQFKSPGNYTTYVEERSLLIFEVAP